MAMNRGPGGSGAASNAASNASAIATVKAQEAAESAASALSSANNAAISASSASASATSASASASAASGSATTASSASSTATTQAGIATTKASEASTSAANALTSETNAATSANLAEDWAIKTSGPVTGSEYSSKYHAGLAATSATSANNAKTAAETARDQTLAVYDSFDDRYLGTKTTDPTVDNDGNPLVAGALYFNSVSGVMRLYTGSAWVAAYVSGTASSIAVTPAGNIASTNVQTALQELDGEKQPTLVSGTNIKTVNGTSLLGSGDVSTTPAAGSITTSMLANNAVTPAKMANGGFELGMRNRIINGAMMIDQRNAGASVSVTATGFPVDRFYINANLFGVISGQRSTTTPAGFVNSTLMTVTTARSSIAASDVYGIRQTIEGLNVADLGWGTASAQTITVSFWARSSIAGTYTVSIFNTAFNRSYVATYTINAANTFEYKTLTIVGDTTGMWATDNTGGINLYFDLGSGSNFQTTAGAWGAAGALRTSGSTNWISTTGATFYITGVQLEKGSTATPFEWRPYSTELALCQRYYWKTYSQNVAPATVTNDGSIAMMANTSGFAVGTSIFFPVEMRSAPTITYYSPTSGASGNWRRAAGAADIGVANYVAPSTRSLSVYNPGAGTNGEGIYGHVTSAIEL